MHYVRLISLAALAVLMFAFAACGGDSKTTTPGGPKLANSPIPTVTPAESTPAVCGPAVELPLPDDFPKSEISVPPDFVVWTVERSPHLRVVGTVNPPDDQNRPPWQVVADALLERLRAGGWSVMLNDKIEGRDFDLTAPDGRTAHFLAQPRAGCITSVNLTYDINWITG